MSETNQNQDYPYEPKWNHRVIKHTATYEEIVDGLPPQWYSIQEVHYNPDDNTPEYHTDSLSVEGETIDELKKELNLMIKSLEFEPINEIFTEESCNDCGGEPSEEWIYESPDSGETIYRREPGDYDNRHIYEAHKNASVDNSGEFEDDSQLDLFEKDI